MCILGFSLECDKTTESKKENGGIVYTRWGKKSCPESTDTSLVYEGVAVSSKHNDPGGGANYLCLPSSPKYWPGGGNSVGNAFLYAAEYEGTIWPSLQNFVPPCAVCYTANKSTVLMIPAQTQCPTGWSMEYGGYLVTKSANNKSYTVFECLDGNPEPIPNSSGASQGTEASFHQVKATCRGIPCPPYIASKEIACVVCSK